jgi:hypothetical protein
MLIPPSLSFADIAAPSLENTAKNAPAVAPEDAVFSATIVLAVVVLAIIGVRPLDVNEVSAVEGVCILENPPLLESSIQFTPSEMRVMESFCATAFQSRFRKQTPDPDEFACPLSS